MKYKIVILLSLTMFTSCNTEELDFSHNKLKGKSIFGYRYGTWKSYYSDGALWQIVNFDSNKMNGKYVEYYQVNMLKDRLGFKALEINHMDGDKILRKTLRLRSLTGTYMKNNSINQLPIKEVGFFKDGKKEGKFISYDTYGKSAEKYFENGNEIAK